MAAAGRRRPTRQQLLSQPRSGARPMPGSPGAPPPRTAARPPGRAPARAAASAATPRPRPARVSGSRAASPRRTVTLGQAARGAGRGARAVTSRRRYSARAMLTAELLAGAGITAIRAAADYEAQADGTLKGRIGHPKGQYGPLPVLAGLIGTFFLLSFLAAGGGTKAKLAVIFGGLVDLVLAMKSMEEFEKVAATFSDFGKAHRPPGDWQTSGTAAGEPVQGSPPSGGADNTGGGGKKRPGLPDITPPYLF